MPLHVSENLTDWRKLPSAGDPVISTRGMLRQTRLYSHSGDLFSRITSPRGMASEASLRSRHACALDASAFRTGQAEKDFLIQEPFRDSCVLKKPFPGEHTAEARESFSDRKVGKVPLPALGQCRMSGAEGLPRNGATPKPLLAGSVSMASRWSVGKSSAVQKRALVRPAGVRRSLFAERAERGEFQPSGAQAELHREVRAVFRLRTGGVFFRENRGCYLGFSIQPSLGFRDHSNLGALTVRRHGFRNEPALWGELHAAEPRLTRNGTGIPFVGELHAAEPRPSGGIFSGNPQQFAGRRGALSSRNRRGGLCSPRRRNGPFCVPLFRGRSTGAEWV